MSIFNLSVDAVFDAFGVAATYTPANGDPATTITVLAKRPDEVVGFGETRIAAEISLFEIRASDVASPEAGDVITLNGINYTVQGTPMRDVERLTWTLEAFIS
ncbi:head-tail joining protein [Magnetofaba australis]|uniref:Head-tail joining protein n=1 Tax=Magnetofaba australis IT-1 TaxID=1434232 RepID=A0A1Y2KA69_9PROT|nr:hypothetical protein [Magnetofaba australis]OSM07597.1 hypothetical protein MAIT1_04425 [Magnetofaba australis IT-1]